MIFKINTRTLAVAAALAGVLAACTDYEDILSEKYESRLKAKLINCDRDTYGAIAVVDDVTYTCRNMRWEADMSSSSSTAKSSASTAKSSSSIMASSSSSSAKEDLSDSTDITLPVDTIVVAPEIYECEDGSFVLNAEDCEN